MEKTVSKTTTILALTSNVLTNCWMDSGNDVEGSIYWSCMWRTIITWAVDNPN